jgi:hypothetical protein
MDQLIALALAGGVVILGILALTGGIDTRDGFRR